MKLLAPANSMQSAISQIECGADELYVGLAADFSSNLSFSARGNFCRDGKRMVLTLDEFSELSALCKDRNVDLDATVNAVHPTGFLRTDGSEVANYLKFLERLVVLNVHSFVIADIAAIRLARREFPEMHITASSELEINNASTAAFYEEIGASRIVLTYPITLDEIRHICLQTSLEVEVFGHRGCSFHPGYCMFKHVVGETGPSGLNVGTPCRNSYSTAMNSEQKPYLDSSLICSICSIPQLVRSGAKVLKLVGRELSGVSNAEVTSFYRRAIDSAMQGESGTIKADLPIWWKKTLCRQSRCRYLDTPISRSYVGTPSIKIGTPERASRASDIPPAKITASPEEQRVLHLQDLPIALETARRCVGVGHEYCGVFIQNQPQLHETLDRIVACGLRPVIVTPVVHALELDSVFEALSLVMMRYEPLDVVFNDWGLLSRVSESIDKVSGSEWWAGRLISRTMADWPWFEVVARYESPEIIRRLACNNVCHDELFDILRRRQIDGVEVNNNSLNQATCALLKANGFRTKVHLNRKLLAGGRSCIYFTDKLGRDIEYTCDGNCGRIRLSLSGLDTTDSPHENNPLLKKYYPDIFLAGCGVYDMKDSTNPLIEPQFVDASCFTI